MRLCLSRIEAALGEISPLFTGTPQYECEPLSDALGCRITLKVETMNPVRCFKGRGTEVAISDAIKTGHRSVVCASAGNLGQAVAHCCRARSVSATVFASHLANPNKLQRIADLGANLQLVNGDIELAKEAARKNAKSENSYLIEDSENLGTCEGAATIGLELMDDSTSFDSVLVALGAGAMATGVGCVVKAKSPSTKLICVQPSGAPGMTLSWRAKTPVATDHMNTIADGVAGRFTLPDVLDDLLEVADDALLVEESSIIEGMRLLYHHAGLVTEPSAALGIAALLENRALFEGKQVASIICGSNVSLEDFHRWVGR